MELAQLCTAPHVEFLFSSLAGHLVGPLAPRHPHLVCALRPAAYRAWPQKKSYPCRGGAASSKCFYAIGATRQQPPQLTQLLGALP